MHVLLAADASWLIDDVVAALGGTNTSFTVCTEGREVSKVIEDRVERGEPVDIGIFDLQIGTMGGVAVTMDLRLDASAGAAPDVPVLMLLDRVADTHLARRSGANGWLVKPLDPLRLRRAVNAVLAGDSYTEGLAGVSIVPGLGTEEADEAEEGDGDAAESAPPEAVTSG